VENATAGLPSVGVNFLLGERKRKGKKERKGKKREEKKKGQGEEKK